MQTVYSYKLALKHASPYRDGAEMEYFRVYDTCTLRRSPYESPCLFSKTIIFVDAFIIIIIIIIICLGAHLQTIANYMLI